MFYVYLLRSALDGNFYIGQTAGRGRMDPEHKAHGQAVKDIYVYPLVRDAQQQLCGDLTR